MQDPNPLIGIPGERRGFRAASKEGMGYYEAEKALAAFFFRGHQGNRRGRPAKAAFGENGEGTTAFSFDVVDRSAVPAEVARTDAPMSVTVFRDPGNGSSGHFLRT